MSLRRFCLYFLAVMACGVAGFPHWMPARSAAVSAPAEWDDAAYLAAIQSARSVHHRHIARLAARD
ncbi:MAG: hypothetical protein JO250_07930 [Armatimonadetes bacterium]|nr:hypothetical protein [Armatimonadota bacterium]